MLLLLFVSFNDLDRGVTKVDYDNQTKNAYEAKATVEDCFGAFVEVSHANDGVGEDEYHAFVKEFDVTSDFSIMGSHETVSDDAKHVEVKQKAHLDCGVVSRDQNDEYKEPSLKKVDWVV